MLAATIILPTTGDRGPTLKLAVNSVLRQTVPDFELLIIGDGANPETCQVARDLESQDPRVKFFEFPKGERRSEHRRHEVLAKAKGRIVCYQIDRDLWFPDHLEVMIQLLENADFAHTLPVRTAPDGQFDLLLKTDLTIPRLRQDFNRKRSGLQLAMGGHTLEAYRRLEEGWATTPPGWFTDSYFWSKFSRDPTMRVNSSARLTIINSPRKIHPGWSTPRRLEDLLIWVKQLEAPDGPQQIRLKLAEELGRERSRHAAQLLHRILIKGCSLNAQGFRAAFHAAADWAKNQRERHPKSLWGRLSHLIVIKIYRPWRDR